MLGTLGTLIRVRRCDILDPFVGRQRDTQPTRAVIGQLSTRHAVVSTDFSLFLLTTTVPLAFFIDIRATDAHGDLPTRQRKAAVLHKTC